MTEQQQQKQQAIDLLEARYRGMENVCEGIDMRLRMYFEDLREHSSARLDDPTDWHGLYELLGAAKFLRCLDTYNFNTKKVQTVIRLREGEWRQVGRVAAHQRRTEMPRHRGRSGVSVGELSSVLPRQHLRLLHMD